MDPDFFTSFGDYGMEVSAADFNVVTDSGGAYLDDFSSLGTVVPESSFFDDMFSGAKDLWGSVQPAVGSMVQTAIPSLFNRYVNKAPATGNAQQVMRGPSGSVSTDSSSNMMMLAIAGLAAIVLVLFGRK